MTNLELNGHEFSVEIEWDDCNEPPWESEDGHGPVSDWRRKGYSDHYRKAPGERLLCEDRGSARFYDIAEATRIARREHWGSDGDEGLTPGAKAARAVEADYWRLRRWCEGDWSYVGVIVTHDATGETESLWGIESDSREYIDEVAKELAEEILANLPDRFEAKRARLYSAYGSVAA